MNIYSTLQKYFLYTKQTVTACLVCLSVSALFSSSAFALTALDNTDLPIKVNADDMVYSTDNSLVTFKGNVVVTRGEFIMHSKTMKIFLNKEKDTVTTVPVNKELPLTGAAPNDAPSTVSDTNNIEKIEADGNVNFTYGNQSGSSQRAVYEAKRGLLTMLGNPVVRDGENTIQGETIRYFVNERRSEVVGSKGKRVEAIFSGKE